MLLIVLRYSDVLAGQEDFQRNAKTIRVVIRALKAYLRCPMQQEDGAQTNRAAIEQMVDKMERYLAPAVDETTKTVNTAVEGKQSASSVMQKVKSAAGQGKEEL